MTLQKNGGVSEKTLRYYDSIDLLKPKYCDDFTGYRYYLMDQIKSIEKINLFKNLGLSLNEIKDYLEKPNIKVLKEIDEKDNYEVIECNYDKYIEINSKEIINKVKEIFKMFYGKEYESLIDERMDNLVDIIFYNNKDLNTDLNDISDYLKYYRITKYNDEIITKKIPISRYILEHGEQGTMMFLDENKLKMVIYFPLHVSKKYNFDCILIHELDEHICYQDADVVVSRGGFETMNLKGDSNNERNYEFLNETLHQRIAEEITKFAHDKGIFLFNNYDESQISNNEYAKDRCIVIEKFYDNFKDDLLVDKMVGNIEDFINIVGNDSFEELNKWIIEYYNKYPTPDIRKELNEHTSNEYMETIQSGMSILNNMMKKREMVK